MSSLPSMSRPRAPPTAARPSGPCDAELVAVWIGQGHPEEVACVALAESGCAGRGPALDLGVEVIVGVDVEMDLVLAGSRIVNFLECELGGQAAAGDDEEEPVHVDRDLRTEPIG